MEKTVDYFMKRWDEKGWEYIIRNFCPASGDPCYHVEVGVLPVGHKAHKFVFMKSDDLLDAMNGVDFRADALYQDWI